MIKTKFVKENFSFKVFSKDAVANAIKNLMTETIDAYCPKLTQIMDNCLKNNVFPDILKTAEINPF